MNGVLALPTNRIPPGAIVKISGWDLSSIIRTSEADAACTRPVKIAMQAANRNALNLGIVPISSLFAFDAQPIYGCQQTYCNKRTHLTCIDITSALSSASTGKWLCATRVADGGAR